VTRSAIRNTILQLRARTTKIWTAVAACRGEAQRRLERSGDTAFRMTKGFQKRRGASLPAAVQKIVVAAKGRVRFIRVHPWLKNGRPAQHPYLLRLLCFFAANSG
jgi:hypothetical protein